ncbi:uncharacterized protein LOC117550754 [Gymnodraco acuticeps]|uniref:Uncharacterized protein LOC117550754 n=1 Tax=Gymnodraco acuticeps TaxID=8218 RepID=A0A6P8URN7_GYMAC|nr:uncharacterized protein LOC117550754 [Gymnodraco acuticeps]
MLTIKQLLGLVQPGDWFTTIDLKDACFHVEIAPKHRKYLRFSFMGVAFEYNRLPFGYSLSPRTFSKCVRDRLRQGGLSDSVVQSIQAARAGSTTACYRPKWLGFQRWCEERKIEPLSCELGSILSYLQLLVDRGLAHSTVKVYAAAISSCHEGFGGRSAFSQPLMLRFLRGVRRLRPVVRASAPQWDLPLVLEALVTEPFDSLELSSIKALLWKTALLLALTSAKRVSELTALSVLPSCLMIRVTLRPNPSFVPNSLRSAFRSRAIQLGGFNLPPHSGAREAKLHLLCPVRALACYVKRTAALRRTEQLFVCFGCGVIGKALSKKRLAGWLCECIAHAYGQAGKAFPTGVRVHSTQAMAVSTALFNGVSVEDICTPGPFIKFYLLDMSGSFSSSVLAGTTQDW